MLSHIREKRQAQGLYLEQLATRLPFTKSPLSQKERHVERVRMEDLVALARALGCHPWDLIEFDEFPPYGPAAPCLCQRRVEDSAVAAAS